MKKSLSKITRISLLLTIFFALDKGVAFIRQVVIARQFGLSPDLDAFNVANNVPDLLFALISGGALAMAFIPILAETIKKDSRDAAWALFSKIANLAFLVTAVLAILVALLAEPLVGMRLGIAPGFNTSQQALVVELMRMNLVATLIFSISGLVMAGLQANQHFLLPAIAPLLYNIGQIFGAIFLAPEGGTNIAGITIPSLGMGIQGLVVGVILGAILHLGVQIPGLIRNGFQWTAQIGFNDTRVTRVLSLMGPRIVTMLFIQFIFLVRDNLASRLETGAVTALTYGWMIMQVPETLIGTAIGTALLPTLSEQHSLQQKESYQQTIQKAVKVLIGLMLPIAAVLSIGITPFLEPVFRFGDQGSQLMVWVTRGFLAGIVGHSLMEVMARSFYARQDALTPLFTAGITVVLYIGLGSILYRTLGAPGISLTDTTAYTLQAVILIFLLQKKANIQIRIGSTIWRAGAAAILGGTGALLVLSWLNQSSPWLAGAVSLLAGGVVSLPWIWTEIKMLLHL
ncbi:MAG TPA: murein biosynthesis integral membrane protein MurJ [Anaerolineaceae bacterium]